MAFYIASYTIGEYSPKSLRYGSFITLESLQVNADLVITSNTYLFYKTASGAPETAPIAPLFCRPRPPTWLPSPLYPLYIQ
jgi:hypothetical protein